MIIKLAKNGAFLCAHTLAEMEENYYLCTCYNKVYDRHECFPRQDGRLLHPGVQAELL